MDGVYTVAAGRHLVVGVVLPPGWDALALRTPSPFLTAAWLDAWWSAFGRGDRVVASLYGQDGGLLAGAALRRTPLGGLAATANDHTGDWDVVAVDDVARVAAWEALAALPAPTFAAGPLRDAGAAGQAFAAARRRLHEAPGPHSPYVSLDCSFDELLARRSSNLRSQYRRRRRAFQGRGKLTLRTTVGGPRLEGDVATILRVEASGWKGRRGTAILSDPATESLYRTFVRAAAERGWLRLRLLELDGSTVAGDIGITIEGVGFLLKTGFDVSWARLSPGLVLRGEVLRACIEEGLSGYDFLGGPEAYKLRWTDDVRPRTMLRGFRGPAALPSEAWRRAVRPALVHGREVARPSARRS